MKKYLITFGIAIGIVLIAGLIALQFSGIIQTKEDLPEIEEQSRIAESSLPVALSDVAEQAKVADQSSKTDIQKLENEWQNVVKNGYGRHLFDEEERLGWNTVLVKSARYRSDYTYHIAKKNNLYGLAIFDKKDMNSKRNLLFSHLFTDIPERDVWSTSCNYKPKTEQEAHAQYCGILEEDALDTAKLIVPEATGVICGLSIFEEMIALIKPPDKCATRSEDIRAAYRFEDGKLKELNKDDITELVCYVGFDIEECPHISLH